MTANLRKILMPHINTSNSYVNENLIHMNHILSRHSYMKKLLYLHLFHEYYFLSFISDSDAEINDLSITD